MPSPGGLDEALAALDADAGALLRSLRSRLGAAVTERFEPRDGAPGRGDLVLLAGGDEVARLLLRPGQPLKVRDGAGEVVVSGLLQAAEVAARLSSAAARLRASQPQLDLFGRR